jgi:hypothetical protein
MFEVFNRLNTGGINLRPQEIRTSMYHSPFYEMLYRLNGNAEWRKLLRSTEPDLHMKDIEILLRGFAMLVDGENYAPSMVKFLNQFSRQCKNHSADQNKYLGSLLESFLAACRNLPEDAFLNKKNRRFNIALYEAVFTAACREAFRNQREAAGELSAEAIATLESDAQFTKAALEGTTRTSNVEMRLDRAKDIMPVL